MGKNSIPKYFIETDILVDFLTKKIKKCNSTLVKLMQKGVCITSVINASEIYFAASSDTEIGQLNNLFYAINVLGIHSRYSLLINKLSNKFNNYRDALIYILAEQNNLIIVTKNTKKYMGLNCEVIHPSKII